MNDYYINFKLFQNGDIELSFRDVKTDEVRDTRRFSIFAAPETLPKFKYPDRISDAINHIKFTIAGEE